MEVVENNKENNKKNNFIKKHFFSIVKYIIIILVLIFAFIIGTKFSNNFKHKEKVISYGFKDMGFLITQEWYGCVLEDSKTDRTFFNLFKIPLTESRQLFSIDIEVFAGIEFKDIKYTIDHNKKNINVSLPHAIIQNTSTVDDSMQIYLDSESWFSRINLEKNEEARESLKKRARQMALDSGIIEKAENNAEKLITNMIKSNGECSKDTCKDYEIIFKYE